MVLAPNFRSDRADFLVGIVVLYIASGDLTVVLGFHGATEKQVKN